MSIAVLGAGQWGKNLVREFHRLGVLSAIVEQDTSKHAFLREQYPSVGIFSAKPEIIGKGIRAVAIATPVPSHFADSTWALEAGFDVFVEKPMVASLSEANALGALATNTNRILMVGHLLLYQPAIRWIESFLKEGGLGDVVSIRQRRMNHGRIRQNENVLWSLGVHDIAVILHLLKRKPTDVRAFGHRYYQDKIEDEVTLNMRFSGNLDVSLEVSWIWPTRERTLHIMGTRGALVFDEIKQHVTLHKKSFSKALASEDAGSEIVFEQKEDALPFELMHFLDCVSTRRTPISDYRNGLEVLEVLDRASTALAARKET